MTDDGLSLRRRQQLGQIVRQRREPSRDLAFAFLRLEYFVGDVQRRQDRCLVRFDDGSLRQYLLKRLVHVCRDLSRVLGRQVGPHRVLLAANHHLDRVLFGAHWAPPPAPGRTPPLPPASRACSSRNVRRERRSWTRPRAASTRWRSVLFSCSRSATRFRVSASGLAADPPRPLLSFSSASALTARARHPASSSATWRRMVSSWSSTCASALSPSYAKLTLQRHQPPRQQRIHVPLAQRPLGVAERAVPSHAAVPRRDAGPPILVEHFEPLEQRPYRPPQDIRDLGGGDVRGQHQRQVPLDRGLQWQRAVCHQVALPRVQPYLETEQWSGPNRRVCLEGAGPTHHAATALHRLPTHRPTRCRFQVTARGGDAHS